MLSPGRWHERVPKGLEQNVRYRLALLDRCEHDRAAQVGIRSLCKLDLLFYVNTFVWQFNPRKKGKDIKVGPFITWDFQDRALLTMLACIEEDEDLCIEKSREMGASWMLLIVFEWLWHFHPWQKFLLISRNEKAVEDEDPDSLFWKIDFMHRYIPDWLMPRMRRRKLFYGNDDNGSTITGQASTGKAGVGGRATAMGIDEFSQIEEDYEVLHRTSDTTGCRIFNFTHKGLDTAAFELTQRVDMRKLNLHWSEHPDKKKGLYRWDTENKRVEADKQFPYPAEFHFITDGSPTGGPHPGLRSPWYDRECKRKGSSRAVAMDLDINPTGSVSQFFDPITIHSLKHTYACPPLWRGDIEFDRETHKPTALVPSPGGSLKLWINPDNKGRLPPGNYAIGGDVSTGAGNTPTCLSILDCNTGEKVGAWVNAFLDPDHVAPIAVALCWLFASEEGTGAYFAWETPGPGLMLGKSVLELGYRNIYCHTDDLTNFIKGTSAPTTPGWNGSRKGQKRLLLEEYRAALSSRRFLNRDVEALDETLAFKYADDGSVQHARERLTEDPTGARENHGDRVIADALVWRISKSKRRQVSKEGTQEVSVGSLAWRRLLADNAHRETVAY